MADLVQRWWREVLLAVVLALSSWTLTEVLRLRTDVAILMDRLDRYTRQIEDHEARLRVLERRGP